MLRLSAVSYLVLGLIGLRGPSTPYQLKRAAERTINYFWPFPHSQLYSEPARLAEAGLLEQDREEGGRRRLLYKLATPGKEALARWLQQPPGEVFEMRDMAVLQLFFSDFLPTDRLVTLADDQVRLYRERLNYYADVQRHNENEVGIERRMAPLRLGVRMAEVCLEFWSEISKNPPPSPGEKATSKEPRDQGDDLRGDHQVRRSRERRA